MYSACISLGRFEWLLETWSSGRQYSCKCTIKSNGLQNQPQFSSLDKNILNIKLHYSHKRIGTNLSSTSSCWTLHKQWSTSYHELSLFFFFYKFHFLLANGLNALPRSLENHSKTTSLMHEAQVMNFKVRLSCCCHLSIVSRPLHLVCN